jgi:biotin operon repressor
LGHCEEILKLINVSPLKKIGFKIHCLNSEAEKGRQLFKESKILYKSVFRKYLLRLN